VVKTKPVAMHGNRAFVHPDFKYLRYDRYGSVPYWIRYYDHVYPHTDYFGAVRNVRERYSNFLENFRHEESYIEWFQNLEIDKYIIFAPPRAAARHKGFPDPFQCTPDPEYALSAALASGLPVIMVGNDDLYDFPIVPDNFIDARNQLNFWQLCELIKNAEQVVSQIGAITCIAGLFGKPTKFLPSRYETRDQQDLHIAGVVFPNQEVIA